ncbi:MAG: DNA-3-methyladenine glycosylase [Verrucomicrobia bacterium]|nr:DNA-3-methyladenine glycosylase [Verrucomicrobiota bacterium]
MLSRSFYARRDPVVVARELLGKVIKVQVGKIGMCAGRIVETEAYGGPLDRASHAWKGKTARNESMFGRPGTAYIYLCYGIHRMFNVVTAPVGIAAAVLIRGVEPVDGLDRMAQRRKLPTHDVRLTAGPGALTRAMGIQMKWDRSDLVCGPIRIEDDGMRFPDTEIQAGRRVGVGYAGPAAEFPWRFSIRGNPWVSRAKS